MGTGFPPGAQFPYKQNEDFLHILVGGEELAPLSTAARVLLVGTFPLTLSGKEDKKTWNTSQQVQPMDTEKGGIRVSKC